MPIYEYLCSDCRRRSSMLVLSVKSAASINCPHCGSSQVERVMSRFATPQSEESRLESLTDPAILGGLDEQDPKSMARFMKQLGNEMGEDVGDVEGMMEVSPDEAGGMDGNDIL